MDVRPHLGPDDGGGAARQEKPTSASSSVHTVNCRHMSMDSRDIERAAKDILLSNIRNKLNLTHEEFRRVWLEASNEEKLMLYDSIS